jgi:hypothetical protein
MSNDQDIRAALKRKLERISGDPFIPGDTLRRAQRRRRLAFATAALGVLASLGVIFVGLQVLEPAALPTEVSPASTPSPSEPSRNHGTETNTGRKGAPPPVTVSSQEHRIDLSAWSYCYGNRCASGSPPANPRSIGSPDEVFVDFPLADWSFTATFSPSGEECGRHQRVRLRPNGDGRFVLEPAGPADAYDVTLFGRGEGSLSVTFRWSTPSDGPLPEPQARAAIITDQNGRPYSYGVELELKNLAETPAGASATITVKAANGNSVTFDAERATESCWPEGTVYWDGPDAKGVEAAKLGDAPFNYEVIVTLDGRRYVGRGSWPADEIRGNEPSVALEFTPPLPRVQRSDVVGIKSGS